MSENSKQQKVPEHGSVRAYIVGFILSLIFTFAAYLPALWHQQSYHTYLPHEFMLPLVLTLAFAQLLVQLFFFLHLGQEKGPRWNLVFLVMTVITILTVVVGSIWIMSHLNYNMMPDETERYIIQDEGMQPKTENR
jgi:cytochrome o ubiquinol oxidase subunit IV